MMPMSPDRSERTILQLVAVAIVTLVAVFSVGLLVGNATGTRPSVAIPGRPALVPRAPAGRSVYIAPLDDFSIDTADALTAYYRDRYSIRVTLLPAAPVDPAAVDRQRHQLVGEDVIASMERAYPDVVRDPGAVLIGLVDEDLYIRGRTDWEWAFGVRGEDRYAVVSTARMASALGSFGGLEEFTRLRKMVTRDIGVLYYGLPLNDDPDSVLYRDVSGLDDLDNMSDEF
jgi:predicted Zn-dependent protease